jgi:hypothetical protein
VDVTEASSPTCLSCILMTEQKLIFPLSCWYHIYQMAEERADCSPFQLLDDNPKDDDKSLHGVVGMVGGLFKGSSVSC